MRDEPLAFHDGRTMPPMGLGIWQVPADETASVVASALTAGYRQIDGAAIYGNEVGLGAGLQASGLARDQVFVTTKLWNDAHGQDAALRAFDASMVRLGLDRLDLYLIHWPCPGRDQYVETWRALIRLRDEGRITSIGVSNFSTAQIDRLAGETGVKPVLNQVELHPGFQQAALRADMAARGIVTQSWSPLGHARYFAAPPIATVAQRLGASPAQVILAWHLAMGCSVIPRSVRIARLIENLAAGDLVLTADDLAAIGGLDAGDRLGPDPAVFG